MEQNIEFIPKSRPKAASVRGGARAAPARFYCAGGEKANACAEKRRDHADVNSILEVFAASVTSRRTRFSGGARGKFFPRPFGPVKDACVHRKRQASFHDGE